MVWFSDDVLSIDMLFANYLTKLRHISLDEGEETVVGSNMFQVQTQQTGVMRCAIGSLIARMELSRYGVCQ